MPQEKHASQHIKIEILLNLYTENHHKQTRIEYLAYRIMFFSIFICRNNTVIKTFYSFMTHKTKKKPISSIQIFTFPEFYMPAQAIAASKSKSVAYKNCNFSIFIC